MKFLLLKAEILQEIRKLVTLLGGILSGVAMTTDVFFPGARFERMSFSFVGFKVLFTHKCILLRKPVGDFD